ncbi:MAG: hypothetical protein R2847_03265 [Bacteroidia bacterium]
MTNADALDDSLRQWPLNPSCIGIGLGEDTGVLITEGHKMEVIGSGLVIIFDGHKIRYNDIADLQDGMPISIENMIVHILTKGNCFISIQ